MTLRYGVPTTRKAYYRLRCWWNGEHFSMAIFECRRSSLPHDCCIFCGSHRSKANKTLADLYRLRKP